jgi:hypothetical protein
MLTSSKAFRTSAVTALVAMVASLLLPAWSKANCCCARAAAVSEEVRSTADDQSSVPVSLPACCAAVNKGKASSAIDHCSGAAHAQPQAGHPSHDDCDCSMTCCVGDTVLITTVDTRDHDLDWESIAPIFWDEFQSSPSTVAQAAVPLSESIDAQSRCARLCRWLK